MKRVLFRIVGYLAAFVLGVSSTILHRRAWEPGLQLSAFKENLKSALVERTKAAKSVSIRYFRASMHPKGVLATGEITGEREEVLAVIIATCVMMAKAYVDAGGKDAVYELRCVFLYLPTGEIIECDCFALEGIELTNAILSANYGAATKVLDGIKSRLTTKEVS